MWDCPACGTQRLLVGSHQYCPSCGTEQVPAAQYLPTDAEALTTAEHPYVGRELACLVCHSLNSAASNHCAGCGRSLADAREMPPPSGSRSGMRRSELSRTGMSSSALSRSGMRSSELSRSGMRPSDSLQAEINAERERQTELSRKRVMQLSQSRAAAETQRSRRRLLLAATGLATLGLIYWFGIHGPDDEARIVGHAWKRSIAIEQFHELVETAPCAQPPRGSQRIGPRGGPDTCAFRRRAWATVREVELAGEGRDSERSWPSYRLRWTGEGNCDMCEREGERREQLFVSASYRGTVQRCELEPELWQSLAVGDSLTVAEAPGGGFDCASLEAAAAAR